MTDWLKCGLGLNANPASDVILPFSDAKLLVSRPKKKPMRTRGL